LLEHCLINLVHFCISIISTTLVQDVLPLDLGELLAYFVKQSVPLFDQLGIKRGKMLFLFTIARIFIFQ
jgi:hypothetical protein